MTLAIEPMITAGHPDVVLLEDRWSIVTEDGSLSAHFEHTVAVTEHGPSDPHDGSCAFATVTARAAFGVRIFLLSR